MCTLRNAVLTSVLVTYLSFNSLRPSHVLLPPPLSVSVAAISDLYNYPELFPSHYARTERDFKVYHLPRRRPQHLPYPEEAHRKVRQRGLLLPEHPREPIPYARTRRAHLFFIPISCHKMRCKGTSYKNMTVTVRNYVDGLSAKYPYWNRTLGADHFFVTFHGVGLRATEGVPLLVKNSIRVVCSPSYDVGFIPHKDVALPPVLQPFALPAGGNDLENRTTLAFWAGLRNSKIRVILARVWENDTELDISSYWISRAVGHSVYQKRFYTIKYCICPDGSHFNGARIVDSIHYGCVPVIISDYYDLPFNDILDWNKFAVVLKEKDI